jgi:hypothetical protein
MSRDRSSLFDSVRRDLAPSMADEEGLSNRRRVKGVNFSLASVGPGCTLTLLRSTHAGVRQLVQVVEALDIWEK